MSIISHLYNQKWFICDKIDFYLFLVNNIINLWIIRTDIKYIGFNFVLNVKYVNIHCDTHKELI